MFLHVSVSSGSLLNTFSVFGSLKVEWPDKDGKHSQCPPQGNQPSGNAVLTVSIPIPTLLNE